MSTWQRYARASHRQRYYAMTPTDGLWLIVLLLGIFCAGVFVYNVIRGPL